MRHLSFIKHPCFLFCVVGVLLAILIYRHAYTARPYEQPQPIAFNHHTHTAANKVAMPCLGCHTGAEHGASAGLPAASTCLNCHRHILRTDARLLPLHAAANADSPIYTAEPLAWVRRAPLPAHVHFHHARHVAARISCEECHPSPNSPTPHTMNSCLQCHKKHSLPTNCDQCHH